jgi:hypothetical protein
MVMKTKDGSIFRTKNLNDVINIMTTIFMLRTDANYMCSVSLSYSKFTILFNFIIQNHFRLDVWFLNTIAYSIKTPIQLR